MWRRSTIVALTKVLPPDNLVEKRTCQDNVRFKHLIKLHSLSLLYPPLSSKLTSTVCSYRMPSVLDAWTVDIKTIQRSMCCMYLFYYFRLNIQLSPLVYFKYSIRSVSFLNMQLAPFVLLSMQLGHFRQIEWMFVWWLILAVINYK